MFFLFFNHVIITKPINMGLRPYGVKSFVDGRRLLCFGFHIPFPILFLINFHSYIFQPIKTYKYEYSLLWKRM